MARGKTTKSTAGSQHRAETKEERKIRLEKQKLAREHCNNMYSTDMEDDRGRGGWDAAVSKQCFKLLPYAGGLVAILLICFGLWVRSVPPRRIKQIQTPGLDIDPEMIKAQMEFERQMQEQQVPPQGENVDAVKQENAAEEHNLDAEDNTQQQQHHHESETQEEPAGGEENDQEPQREEDTPQGEL